jgi:hypothetical protein
MGFVQSQRPTELTYMPTYQLPEDVQLAEGVNRDLYNQMLMANLSGQQQQKMATSQLLEALPEADLADLVNMYGAEPGYLLTQGGRARQPEYTNIEQLQRAAYQRNPQAQSFNPFSGQLTNMYGELPYGSFSRFSVNPNAVASSAKRRFQKYYTPTEQLISEYGLSPEQAFETAYNTFNKRNLFNLADATGLGRDYASQFASQRPEYVEINPFQERILGSYSGNIEDYAPRQLSDIYGSGSPVFSMLGRRYFDPQTGRLNYLGLDDPRFNTQNVVNQGIAALAVG